MDLKFIYRKKILSYIRNDFCNKLAEYNLKKTVKFRLQQNDCIK